MANKNPTIREVAKSVDEIRSEIETLRERVDAALSASTQADEAREAIHVLLSQTEALRADAAQMREDASRVVDRLENAVGSGGRGLDGPVSRGLAEIAEMLSRLQTFAPPTTAEPLAPGVAVALGRIRRSLGEDRDTNFASLVTAWDGPVGFIGEANPDDDGGGDGGYHGNDHYDHYDEEVVA